MHVMLRNKFCCCAVPLRPKRQAPGPWAVWMRVTMYLCGRQSARPQSTVMACCDSQSMTCQVDGVTMLMLLADASPLLPTVASCPLP